VKSFFSSGFRENRWGVSCDKIIDLKLKAFMFEQMDN